MTSDRLPQSRRAAEFGVAEPAHVEVRPSGDDVRRPFRLFVDGAEALDVMGLPIACHSRQEAEVVASRLRAC